MTRPYTQALGFEDVFERQLAANPIDDIRV